MTLKHAFNSAIADDPADVTAGKVVPTNWNADHVTNAANKTVLYSASGAVTGNNGFTYDPTNYYVGIGNGNTAPNSGLGTFLGISGVDDGAGFAGMAVSVQNVGTNTGNLDGASFNVSNVTANPKDSMTGFVSRVSGNATSEIKGFNASITYQAASGTLAAAYGAYIRVSNGDAGTITEAVGVNVAAVSTTSGPITTAYGVKVADITTAGTNYNCWFGSGLYHFTDLTASAVVLSDASSNLSSVAMPADATKYLDGTGAFSTPAGGGGGSGSPGVPCGRLTLTTGVPVTNTDVTGATTIYYTPYNGNNIPLWNGSAWAATVFTQVSLSLGTLSSGKPYDVFGFLNTGALNTELLAWTNTTTRATAITLQDGMYCKSGDHTRLYLGTFYTTSTTATEDSVLKRFVFNMYNRVGRLLLAHDATASWTYGTNAYRQANASSANQVEMIVGVADVLMDMTLKVECTPGTASDSVEIAIGEDSTSTPEATCQAGYFGAPSATGQNGQLRSFMRKYPAVGYHKYVWLETVIAAGPATTFYGDETGGRGYSGLSGGMQA